MHYITLLAIALGINMILFIPAFLFKTDKLTDLSYSLSFILVAIFLFLNSTANVGHIVLLGMILLWALRLGTYLFIRIRKMKKDKRFDGIREHFLKFLQFWAFQGVSVFVILLAATSYFYTPGAMLTAVSYIGLAIWALGLTIETVADIQKYRFIQNKKEGDAFIDTGLWSISRHPNYFGEILVWLGVFIFTCPVLIGINTVIAAISPIYIAAVLIFITGLPPLERSADAKWGELESYQTYKANTPVLVPFTKFKKKETPSKTTEAKEEQ